MSRSCWSNLSKNGSESAVDRLYINVDNIGSDNLSLNVNDEALDLLFANEEKINLISILREIKTASSTIYARIRVRMKQIVILILVKHLISVISDKRTEMPLRGRSQWVIHLSKKRE